MASDLCLQKVQLATDLLSNCKNLQGVYLGLNSVIIGDIKEKQREFVEARITHEQRDHNYEAHNLAKAAVTLNFGRHALCMAIRA